MLAGVRNFAARLLGITPAAPPARPRLQARYEAAQNTDENAKMWGQVDLLSARAANSYQVRRVLRTRAGYEFANGPFARGMLDTVVSNLIGTGPTPAVDCGRGEAANDQILAAWSAWWRAVDGLGKLKVIAKAKKGRDGEGILILATYDKVADPVQLYPREIEADQMTTPMGRSLNQLYLDGLTIDDMGNPVSYSVLKIHPGDTFFQNLNPFDVDVIPARFVIHWFKKDRPGQVRGIPEITPALELLQQIRNFRRVTLTAAQIAAVHAFMLESEAPADGSTVEPNPMSTLQTENGMGVELPYGYHANQLKAEHPATTYEMFLYCLMAEACRVYQMPLNVAIGTSQKFNFSSARLDHMNYHEALRVERVECEVVVMCPLFWAWFDEAVMIPGLLPDGITAEECALEWHWPPFPNLDPLKDAQADTEQLQNKTKTYKRYYAEQGKDWEDEFEQLAAEKDKLEELGITAPANPLDGPSDPNSDDGDSETADTEAGDESDFVAYSENQPRDARGRFASTGTLANGTKVKFTSHPARQKYETTIFVHAKKLDEAWRKDANFYIPHGGGGAEIPGRRAGVEAHLASGKTFQASRIVIDKAGKIVSFTDGRHRFSVLRDRGIDRVAVTVNKKQLPRFKHMRARWSAELEAVA